MLSWEAGDGAFFQAQAGASSGKNSVFSLLSTFLPPVTPPFASGQVLLSAQHTGTFISMWLLTRPYRCCPPRDTVLHSASLTYIPPLEMNGLVFGCIKHMLLPREGSYISCSGLRVRWTHPFHSVNQPLCHRQTLPATVSCCLQDN